jgi:hypothetical protein
MLLDLDLTALEPPSMINYFKYNISLLKFKLAAEGVLGLWEFFARFHQPTMALERPYGSQTSNL